ncbi:MAG: HAD-IA family hydrolase [Myxococcota bacterium]
MTKAAIDVVLFDLGGVLVELEGPPVPVEWSEAAEEQALWDRWLTCPWVQRFERGGCDVSTFAAGFVDTWRLSVEPDVFTEHLRTWPRGLFPDAEALVLEVAERTRVGCLSNTNALHWDGQLDAERLRSFFPGAAFASHELGCVKPGREIYERALAALSLAPERVLFLDDSPRNVAGAESVGLHARHARGPAEARGALAEFGLVDE